MRRDLASGNVTFSKCFYHAGKTGLRKGDRVLPPAITGVDTSHRAHIADYRNDRVYMTSVWALAFLHAVGELVGRSKRGENDPVAAVYEVELAGSRERDPYYDEVALAFEVFEAESALVRDSIIDIAYHELHVIDWKIGEACLDWFAAQLLAGELILDDGIDWDSVRPKLASDPRGA